MGTLPKKMVRKKLREEVADSRKAEVSPCPPEIGSGTFAKGFFENARSRVRADHTMVVTTGELDGGVWKSAARCSKGA